MKPIALTTVCVVLAVLSVVFDRLVLPALLMIFKHIEESFAPVEPELAPVLVAASTSVPVAIAEAKPRSKPRTRKRSTSSKKPAAGGG